MRLRLDLAYVDLLKIHDVADLAGTETALSAARRTVAPRLNRRDLANRHGARDETKLYGGQTIDLSGYADSLAGPAATEAAYDRLRAACALPGPHVLRFRRKGRADEEQVEFTQAEGFDAPAAGDAETIRWAVSLFAPDPRVYGAALKSASYDPTAVLSGGGAAMPLVFPLVFTTTTATLLVVENDGTFATPPIFTIAGPVSNPTIDQVDTGETIALEGGFGASDAVEVDVRARTVRLNGADRPDLLSAALSTWFSLPPGTNRLRLGGAGMSGATTRLSVAYRDARI